MIIFNKLIIPNLRPSSRASNKSERLDPRVSWVDRPGSGNHPERPHSRSGRTKQPVLGTLGYQPNLFEDDPGKKLKPSQKRLFQNSEVLAAHAPRIPFQKPKSMFFLLVKNLVEKKTLINVLYLNLE